MPFRSWFVALILLVAGFVPASAAPAESRVNVGDGVEIRVLRAGPANDRTPIILVPGWGMSADVWSAQVERFSRDRTVIAIDPRSQGQSSLVAWGNTPEQRARDLHAVIQSLRLTRPPVLVGWSQGVQDMAAYVERHGDGELAGVVLDIYAAHQREYLQSMMAAIISKPQPAGSVEGLIETAMRTPPSIGVAMLVADLYGADRTGALGKLKRPALVIASAASPELEIIRSQTAGMADGRLEVVEDAAHAVFLDQPVRFGDLVQAFLDRLDRKSA